MGQVLRSSCRATISPTRRTSITYSIRIELLLHLAHPLAKLVDGSVERIARLFCPSVRSLNLSSCAVKVTIGFIDGFKALVNRIGESMEDGLGVLHDDAETLSERGRRPVARCTRV